MAKLACPDFDTTNEHNKLGVKIFQEKISKIPGDFKKSTKWNDSVDNIVSKVKENLLR